MVTLYVFRVLSVGLRKAIEFRDYSFSALLVFYKCKFQYKLPGHKCDQYTLFWACCFHFENLCWQWFVCVPECEFDNTDKKGTRSIEWRRVSWFCKRRSVKWYLNTLNHEFWTCGSPTIICISANVYSCAT